MQLPPMSVRLIVLLLAWTFAAVAVDSTKYSNSITLSYEFIGGSPSLVKPLATIFYDPKSLKHSLESWTPPALDTQKSTTPQPTSSKLLRILLPNGSSTVTRLDAFQKTLSQRIDLWLSPDGDGTIFSASVSSVTPPPLTAEEERQQKKIERALAKGKPIPKPTPKTKKAKKELEEQEAALQAKKPSVQVNLVSAGAGPAPKLNSRKPPQVDAEGREIPAEAEPEKSFFQKYWWVFVIGAVITMATGGGEK